VPPLSVEFFREAHDFYYDKNNTEVFEKAQQMRDSYVAAFKQAAEIEKKALRKEYKLIEDEINKTIKK
jgi:hypothetical protein